jgi:hypothetical protein
MTKDRLWQAYVDKYPQFEDPNAVIKITSTNLRKMFDQTWRIAKASAFDLDYPESADPSTFTDLETVQYLKNMFGFK